MTNRKAAWLSLALGICWAAAVAAAPTSGSPTAGASTAGASTAGAVPAIVPVAPAETFDGAELRVLFDRKSEPASRQATMQKLVRLAQAGHGYPAFYLGVLYRHGMEHPARLVERDVETARHWLEACVASAGCPLIALASLAELELAEGNAKPAMQWAQAWVVLDREADKQSGDPNYKRIRNAAYLNTAYQAYLIWRCYKAMGSVKDPDAVGRQWFDELRRQRGQQLDRMLFVEQAAVGDLSGNGLEISAENQRTKYVDADDPVPLMPAYGLYLYEPSPAGGRAETVFVIEALPKPINARGLDVLARNIKTRYVSEQAAAARGYALMPVSYSNREYSLIPVH